MEWFLDESLLEGKKKRRRPLTVAESKERKVKRMTSKVIRRMNRLDQRVVPLIHEIAEMKQNMS